MTIGALTQIITSYGAEDLYLTIEPQMTYFRSVYKRYSNFAIETLPVEFISGVDFGKSCRALITRNGDLLSKIYVHIKINSLNGDYTKSIESSRDIEHNNTETCYCTECLINNYKATQKYGWINSLGHAIIKSVYIEIGGIKIDKHYGEWLEIWSELTVSNNKRQAYNELINKVDPKAFTNNTFTDNIDIYVPLQFWFCRDYGLALPLISLQYHEVYICVDFRQFNDCWVGIDTPPVKPDITANLLVDYIFIDLEERQQFINKSHLYLIEQLQLSENHNFNGKHSAIDFYFNHPVKELYWILQREDVSKTKDWFNFGPFLDRSNNTLQDMITEAQLQINGSDRTYLLPAKYFRLINKFSHHNIIPNNLIYSYSFCLYPDNIEPSGSFNFSKIDNAKLIININHKTNVNYKIRIYAINYNVLMITSGMGSTLFQ